MIPRYDVAPTLDVDYLRLRIPTAYKVVNGFAVVRDYEPLIDVEWDDARQCVEAEAQWLARAARASTAEEFDRILASAAEEEAPDDFDWLFRYLDVGVAGLTLVLSAAHYATCYSCRVHPGIAGERMPQVIMAAEPQRVRVLTRYATRADCGVQSMDDGLVCVYAASVDRIHSLAEMMLGAQAELAKLPRHRGVHAYASSSIVKTLANSNGPMTRWVRSESDPASLTRRQDSGIPQSFSLAIAAVLRQVANS